MLNITNIPAPRVNIIDEKTGLISREWYRFFLNLFTLVGQGNNQTSLDDLQVGPPAQNINILVAGSATDLAPPAVTPMSVADNQALLPPFAQQSFDDSQAVSPPFVVPSADDSQALLPAAMQIFIDSYANLSPPIIPPGPTSSGTVTSVDVSGGTTGMTFTGGPITSSGTITMSGTLAVANGGTGSTTLDGAGIVTKTGTQTISGQKNFTSYTNTFLGTTYATSDGGTGSNAYFGENSAYAVVGGANGVVLASGATYPGTSRYVGDATSFRPSTTASYSSGTLTQRWTTVYSQNLDLSGVVAAGTWNGSTITVGYGGTGVTSTPSNGQLLIGNGSGYSLATLTAGSNISISNGAGSITISASGSTGVSSVDVSGGTTGLTTSGGPITSSGTITLGGTLNVANGGTGSSSLTGAGIVTLTDSQVISGQKNFTSYSSTYAGTTYATTNAYFGESGAYAVIGGVNGVVLASGSTYPGTSRYVGDATSFRPSTTASYSSGTLSQRWTTVYSQNLDLSGVVAAGTWNGSTIGIGYGGTGVTSTPSNGQLLIGNGSGYSVANLTAGTNISISNSSGGITISATGGSGTVTSVSGSGGTTGLTLTGGPITTSGTLTLGGTLAVANGGTGATSLTGAGIVTTTDTQTISGVKTFSSTSNAFVGATYKTANGYFYDDTTYGIVGGPSGVLLAYGSYPGTVIFAGDSGTWRPTTDNVRALGTASFRYTVVYATTGTINTSDANQKQQIRDLSDAEQRTAQRVKKLIRAFKWNDAVEAKGDEARIHFGVIAQEVQEAFAAEGLDASKYGLFCSDTWTTSDGSSQTRLGVRYSELLAFIIAAL